MRVWAWVHGFGLEFSLHVHVMEMLRPLISVPSGSTLNAYGGALFDLSGSSSSLSRQISHSTPLAELCLLFVVLPYC